MGSRRRRGRILAFLLRREAVLQHCSALWRRPASAARAVDFCWCRAYPMAVVTSYVRCMCMRPRVWMSSGRHTHLRSELSSGCKTLEKFGRVCISFLGAWHALCSLGLGRDPVMKIQRRNAIKPEFTRTTGEFEMYRSSREGVSDGSRSCTCQNGVTQTRVRGGTEIIRTTSAGARASWPCASRRRRRRRPRWRRRRTRRRRPRPRAAPS